MYSETVFLRHETSPTDASDAASGQGVALRFSRYRFFVAGLLCVAVVDGLIITDTASSSAGTSLPLFTSSTAAMTAAQLGRTWHPGCPISPDKLRLLTLRYVDFDGRARVGTIVVNASVVRSVIQIFATLYTKRFPLHSMVPESHFAGSDPRSMAANNTLGFNCRRAITSGPPQWSVHAYGEAIDVNPVENPYVFNGAANPAAGGAFVNRRDVRAGMAEPGGVLNDAFASVGWYWGGRWTGSPDYQHYSATGG